MQRLKTEHGWVKADAHRDGKYLIWEADGSNITFRSIEKTSSPLFLYIAAGIVAVMVLGFFLIRKRKMTKKALQPEEESTENKSIHEKKG